MYKLLIVFFFFLSCKEGTKTYLISNSAWAIDSITSNGEGVKHLLQDNLLIFKKESFRAPFLHIGMEKGDHVGSWEVIDEQTINIISKNEFLNGTFKICFKKHKKDNVIELYMVSDSISILAHSPNKIGSEFFEPPILCNDSGDTDL